MQKDYFILKRSIVTDQLYFLEKFSKFQAWQDLIYLANWDTGSVKQGFDIINLERGELCHAEDYLCQRWRWSKGKVRRFLNWCVKDERLTIRQIVTGSNQRRNVVKLVNYDKHQIPLKYSSNTLDNTDSNQDSNQTNNNPNNKPNKSNIVEEILNDLNRLTGKNFRHTTKDFVKTINARLNEGYTLEDFKKVNKTKFEEWKHDAQFSRFLRPATLYCAKHFDTYLNTDNRKKSTYNQIDEESFNSLYNSEMIIENSKKNQLKAFKVGLQGLNREDSIKYFEKETPLSWRQNDLIKNAYKKHLNALSEKEQEQHNV